VLDRRALVGRGVDGEGEPGLEGPSESSVGDWVLSDEVWRGKKEEAAQLWIDRCQKERREQDTPATAFRQRQMSRSRANGMWSEIEAHTSAERSTSCEDKGGKHQSSAEDRKGKAERRKKKLTAEGGEGEEGVVGGRVAVGVVGGEGGVGTVGTTTTGRSTLGSSTVGISMVGISIVGSLTPGISMAGVPVVGVEGVEGPKGMVGMQREPDLVKPASH
jgi:hypothetical protein